MPIPVVGQVARKNLKRRKQVKKIFSIALVLAVVASLAFGTVALAGPGDEDPVVDIDASTDRLDNHVHGNFTSGTFSWTLDASTGTHSAVTTMNVSGANLFINSAGVDTTVCHPGTAGQWNDFRGVGDFTATYSTSTNGNYGILGSYINATSGAGGATFQMWDTQDFNIMSGNVVNNVVGGFYAEAYGTDNQVAMNLKSVGSMYVWSEATNPWSAPALRGNYIEKWVQTTQNTVLKTDLWMRVNTSGIANISNSNIWGWTNGQTGTSSTNYGGGTRTVSATGTGTYDQAGYGANQLNFNGFTLPAGGSINVIANFVGGFSGTYSMNAN